MTIGEGGASTISVVRLDDPLAPPVFEQTLPTGGGHGLRWSPDGNRLRFRAPGPGGRAEPWLWETSLSDGPPRPLWPGWEGAWTPDGRRFVFERFMPRALRSDIYAASERHWLPWTHRKRCS